MNQNPLPADLRPEAGDYRMLKALFGIGRTLAYALEKEGEIKASRLRKRGQVLGRVLYDFDSVRAYLARCITAEKDCKPAKKA